MNEIVIIGIDLAGNVFPLHGVDAAGAVVVRRTLRRSQMPAFFAKLGPCLTWALPDRHGGPRRRASGRGN